MSDTKLKVIECTLDIAEREEKGTASSIEIKLKDRLLGLYQEQDELVRRVEEAQENYERFNVIPKEVSHF